MKIAASIKFVFIIVLFFNALGSDGQTKTFYMDSIHLERGKETLDFNRFNSPVYLLNTEIVKSVFLGVLDKDSLFMVLKQGLINYNNKFVPVLLYSMRYTDKMSIELDSIVGDFQMFSPRSSTKSTITSDGFGELFFSIKADSTTYRLLPHKQSTAISKYDIIHKLNDITIAKKTIKSTATSQTTGLLDNQFSKPYSIADYKKVPLFYTVSVHPIDNFPELKLVCLSYRIEKDKPSYYSSPSVFLMRGKEGSNPGHSNGYFFFPSPGKSGKINMMRCSSSIFVSQKN